MIECWIKDRSAGDRTMGNFTAAPGCVPRVGDLLTFVSPIYGTDAPTSWQVTAVLWHVGDKIDFVLDTCFLICQPAPGPYWPNRAKWMPEDAGPEVPS